MASGHAGDAMGRGEAVIVAGIGCRKGATAAQIEAAIVAALERAGARRRGRSLAPAAGKRERAGDRGGGFGARRCR